MKNQLTKIEPSFRDEDVVDLKTLRDDDVVNIVFNIEPGHSNACPCCGSNKIRKASAVFENGTRKSTRYTTGNFISFGLGRRGGGTRAGFLSSHSTGRNSSIAAEKADKARILWWGPREALGLCIMPSLIFLRRLAVHRPFDLRADTAEIECTWHADTH